MNKTVCVKPTRRAAGDPDKLVELLVIRTSSKGMPKLVQQKSSKLQGIPRWFNSLMQEQRNLELFQQVERLARCAHIRRGRICMLVGQQSSYNQDGSPKKTSLGNSSNKESARYREQIRNQLVKDKPAGQADQEEGLYLAKS
ncbi:aspartate--tRNA ligase, mitochondrial [Dorcoceras hygrometricum]|uniref:Aspartate--tRNA ligase, mitochondrial n=1 Tax=Dorcoceras hygrometricum TaxID=472368 RepID=A0A2Z7AP53_9LAMI|nr:aspartate--tRNA ligase, mitochondrial [Dorcoceras hygrometricum]